MPGHNCIDCGLTVNGEAWKVRCIRCYKQYRRTENQKTAERIRREDRARAGLGGDGPSFTRLSDIPPEGTRPIFMDRETYRKVLSLCHPDKHDNSPAANEVTQKLLEHRRDY